MNEQAWTELRRRYPWPDEPPDAEWTEQGWCGVELQEYFDRLLNHDMRLIVEVGSWLGLSARYMMKVAPSARVICIDHWRGSASFHSRLRAQPGGIAPKGHWLEYLPNLYERFIKRMWEYRERVVPMRRASPQALIEVAELELTPDFLYIDGAHDTASVSADIAACAKHFPGVQLMGDDWRLATVRKAVEATRRPIEHNRLAWAFTQ